MAATKTKAEAKVSAQETDEWKVMKEIFITKAPKGEDNFIIASVNGKVFKIKRGINVKVPLPIYRVIQHSFARADKADEFIEKANN